MVSNRVTPAGDNLLLRKKTRLWPGSPGHKQSSDIFFYLAASLSSSSCLSRYARLWLVFRLEKFPAATRARLNTEH
jgi:hypothetical protein